MTKLHFIRLTYLVSLCSFCLTTSTVWSESKFQHPKIIDDDIVRPTDSARGLVEMAYIIRFNSNTTDVSASITNLMNTSVQDGGKIRFIYENVFNGFSVSNMSNARMTQILDNAEISDASRMYTAYTSSTSSERGSRKLQNRAIQSNAVWNLDMLTSPYNDNGYTYKYTGRGVRAFVLDTGIDYKHEQFGGRASCGWDAYDTNCVDRDAHGTHVAGTVGSNRYGVAKKVTLIGVKVLNDNGEGTYDAIIAGVDWVIKQKRSRPFRPMVIVMSLGGGYSSVLNKAIASATSRGITVVVAAGNGYGTDACTKSPASAETAITVGNTDYYNQVSYSSNAGSCVDIMAPGEFISSVASCSKYRDCYNPLILSGTSMATPLVGGIAALHLQKNRFLRPSRVWAKIRKDARTNEVRDIWFYGVPDLLVSASSLLRWIF